MAARRPRRGGRAVQRRCPLAKYLLRLADRDADADLEPAPDGGFRVKIGGEWRSASLRRLGATPRYVLTVDGNPRDIVAIETDAGFDVFLDGVTYKVEALRRRRRDARGHAEDALVDGKWQLRSPMTGSVMEIRVQEGERVEAGAVLLVLEAMKMQNELRARVAGVVEAIHVSLGQRVEAASVLLEVKVEA